VIASAPITPKHKTTVTASFAQQRYEAIYVGIGHFQFFLHDGYKAHDRHTDFMLTKTSPDEFALTLAGLGSKSCGVEVD